MRERAAQAAGKPVARTHQAACVAGADTVLGLIFDPRYRDFPFAALTMAAVPCCILMLLNRPLSGSRPIAESVFAGLFAAASLDVSFHEGLDNRQALWTSSIYGVLGMTLWCAKGPPAMELTRGEILEDQPIAAE